MKRVIIYGDIHGCLDELKLLRKKIVPKSDDIEISVGDFMQKGPLNIETLRYLKEYNIASVKGNNEEKMLKFYQQYQITPEETLEQLRSDEKESVKNFTKEDYAFLNDLPYFIKIHNLTVIHAGLENNTILDENLSKETKHMLTLLRFFDKEMQIVKNFKQFQGKKQFWSEVYNGHEGFIVFGHHPFTEPKIEKYAIGIDTGCVYGGILTAIVFHIENDHIDTENYQFFRQQAAKNYFAVIDR
jgi:hypothetical protein